MRLFILFLILWGCKQGESIDEGVTSVGSFCHPLALDDDEITLSLRLGEGDERVTLSASTGECSSSLGESCKAIPVGTDVPFELIDHNGDVARTGDMVIESDSEYLFQAVFENDQLAISGGKLDAKSSCADLECSLGLYNATTCDESDPCGWVENQYCDDACDTRAERPLDDTADCVVDCDNITDGPTCVSCLCEEDYDDCLENDECAELMGCVNQCADDTCSEACRDAHPEGVDDFIAFLECAIENCSEF